MWEGLSQSMENAPRVGVMGVARVIHWDEQVSAGPSKGGGSQVQPPLAPIFTLCFSSLCQPLYSLVLLGSEGN